MADDFGVSFAPTDANQKTRSTDPNANVQEAIRTLSLHIPKVVGAKSAIPQGLLAGPGSQGVGMANGMGLEQILALLFGQQRPGGQMGAAPSPNFVPGVNPGEPSAGTFNPGGVDFGPPPTPAPSAPSAPSKFIPEQRMPDAFP